MNRFSIITLTLILSLSTNVLARDWSAYTSKNLVIYTDKDQKTAKRLLADLEVFRRTVLLFTGIPDRPENNRLRILLYGNGNEFKKLGINSQIVGIYFQTSSGPRMVIRPSLYSFTDDVLFHEYVHYLLREHSDGEYPRWYDEGIAEVFASIKIKKKKIVFGASSGRGTRVRRQNLLPIELLIDPNSSIEPPRNNAGFYATAWFFVHYLQIGTFVENTDLKDRTQAYLQRYSRGENPVAAFEKSFGMTMAEMDLALNDYKDGRTIPVINIPKQKYGAAIKQSKLSRGEEADMLANIALHFDKVDFALTYLSKAEDSKDTSARALSLQAMLEDRKGNTGEANRLRDTVFSFAEEDSVVFSHLAGMEWNRYQKSAAAGSGDRDSLHAALEFGAQSTSLDPSNLDAHRYSWKAHAASGSATDAAKSMMAAFELQPKNLPLNLEIGSYLAGDGLIDLARPFLERVVKWTHDDEQKATAELLLSRHLSAPLVDADSKLSE